jgi:hypothetical protein
MAWHPTSEAARLLHKHPETLHRRRSSGDLKMGVHVRSCSSRNAKRPDYEWNVPAIELLWNIPIEKR